MDKQNHNMNRDSWQDPWDTEFFETGSTRPPKKRRGLFALVLVCGIILGSILTAFGGIKLLRLQQWNAGDKGNTLPLSLHAGNTEESAVPSADPTDASAAPETTQATEVSSIVTTPVTGDVEVELNTSPEGVDTVAPEGGMALQDIYEKCIPSTVSILCEFSRGSATGSGVVLSRDGYVITNYHVVEGATAISVLFTDGRELTARMVGGDKLSDLAVLVVDAQDLIPAEFGDSDSLRVGDTVVAIGDPLGIELRGTMTDGIVSAINRNLTTEGRTLTLIQTNAALNSGNSGGPLINCYGQVIGINTMKIGDYVSSSGVEGLGFAIPSTTVKQIVDQLISQGYVSGRPGLGIQGVDVPEFYQFYYRLPAGVYVNAVEESSDAYAKGIQVKDIILALDDYRVESTEDIETVLYNYKPGDTVKVVVYRSGRQYQVELVLSESVS